VGTRRPQAELAAPVCKALFAQALLEGWGKIKGEFYYTLDWNGNAVVRDPTGGLVARGRASGFLLNAIESDPIYEQWYRRIWNFIGLIATMGSGEHRSALGHFRTSTTLCMRAHFNSANNWQLYTRFSLEMGLDIHS
jgi:hypothetical protein